MSHVSTQALRVCVHGCAGLDAPFLCVVCLCSDARKRESLPAEPERHGKAALVWGICKPVFSSSGGGGGAPFGFVPGAAACVPGVWAARCGHGLDCYLSGGSEEAMDALSSQAPAWVPELDKTTIFNPIRARKARQGFARRMGVETACLVPGGAPSCAAGGTYMARGLKTPC